MSEKLQIKVLIVEDEPLIAEDMQRRLTSRVKEVVVANSLKQARTFFSSGNSADLLMLDIQLSDGTSFQLLDEFSIKTPVIFATAYDEYAIRAFRVNSVDYLLKPVDDEQIERALTRYQERHLQVLPDLKVLLNTLNSKDKRVYRERFLVQVRNNQVVVKVSDIACFVRDQLIFGYTFSGEKYIIDMESLDLLEDELDPEIFFRSNRQSIVQLSAVDRFKADSTGKLFVHLKSGYSEELDVSREKARAFKTWLEK